VPSTLQLVSVGWIAARSRRNQPTFNDMLPGAHSGLPGPLAVQATKPRFLASSSVR